MKTKILCRLARPALALGMWLLGSLSGQCFWNSEGHNDEAAVADAVGPRAPSQCNCEHGGGIHTMGPIAKAEPFRVSAEPQEKGMELRYYGYRYYNASTGRWISRDPLEEKGGLNLQSFVANEPLHKIDPDGRALWARRCCCYGLMIEDKAVQTGVEKVRWKEEGGPNFHVWLTWDVYSVDSNAGSYGPINPMMAVRPAGGQTMPQYQTPAPKRTPVMLSPCKFDFVAFRNCLTQVTERYRTPQRTGMFCDEFVEDLIEKCKAKSKGCTPTW